MHIMYYECLELCLHSTTVLYYILVKDKEDVSITVIFCVLKFFVPVACSYDYEYD
jgi:hypothetical protein